MIPLSPEGGSLLAPEIMNVTAIIPVKAGSRRLQNKSAAPFLGSNLLERKIDQLARCRMVDRIVVSSECREYLQTAQRMGVGIHHRDPLHSKPESLIGDVVRASASSVEGDVILWAHSTSPLVGPMLYDQALEKFSTLGPSWDSLVSVMRLYEFIWDPEGPINYGFGSAHANTQDVSPLWRVTCGIFVASRKDMIRWGYYVGERPYRFELDKKASIDIDDELDLYCAEEMERMSPELSEIVYGNKVAVIGSGEVRSPEMVNECDEVIRVNIRYPWDDGIERTSRVWHTGDYCGVREMEELRELAGSVPVVWGKKNTREEMFHEAPDHFGEGENGVVVPLSGTQCVYECLQSGAEEVVLDGFDFFSGRDDPIIPFENEPGCFHNCRRDKDWMMGMMGNRLRFAGGEVKQH